MKEIQNNNDIKVIAFYLPQYHTIPENDNAWGKGFTEWTNVKKASPLFEGHYQPRIPLKKYYYNLLDDGVMEKQCSLAKAYGVFGFCYYHYWFKGGKKLLEKPIEKMLNSNIDMPFCLCWANENWTRKWDGGNKEVIVEQDYGGKREWENHFQYFLKFFKDERYICLNGNPLLIIYQPNQIPCVQKMLTYWEKRIKQYGYEGICFVIQNGASYFDPKFFMGKFNYQIRFEPFFSYMLEKKSFWKIKKSFYTYLNKSGLFWPIYNLVKKVKGDSESYHNSKADRQTVLNYDKIWKTIISNRNDKNILEGAFIDWDNTPRTKTGYRVEGANPRKFEKYFGELLKKIIMKKEIPVVFINAWNEWGEGAYLEPDEKYGYSYLEALRRALNRIYS